MKLFTSILAAAALILVANFASAQEERFEVGMAAGKSSVLASSTLKDTSSQGDNQSYWIGYGIDANWGLELGLDYFDFDKIDSKHESITISGVYRFVPENVVHPIVKLGLSTVTTRVASGFSTNSLAAKVMAGAEVDFKYASVGAGVNYHYISKVGDLDSLKNAQAYVPMIFITFHNDSSVPTNFGSGMNADDAESASETNSSN